MSVTEKICGECGHDIPCACKAYRVKALEAANERLRQERDDAEDDAKTYANFAHKRAKQLDRALLALKRVLRTHYDVSTEEYTEAYLSGCEEMDSQWREWRTEDHP